MKRSRAPLAAVVLALLSRVALADPPLAPGEVRERRLLREERPLWREALALPYDALLVLAWPLKPTLIWAEQIHLDDRIANLVHFGHGKDEP